jgi:hypothetical protein
MPSSGTVRLVRPAAPLGGGVGVMPAGKRSDTWWTTLPMATGTYNNSTVPSNGARVFAFRLAEGFAWDTIGVDVVSNVTSASATIAIYDLSALSSRGIGNRIWTSGLIDCATTGFKTDATGGRIGPGAYGVVAQSTTADAVLRGVVASSWGQPLMNFHGSSPATTSQAVAGFNLPSGWTMGQGISAENIDSTAGLGNPVPIVWWRRR